MQQQPITPFLRWAGSKRQLLGELAPYWNGKYKRYVEPFVGSACLFFKLQPKKALLGDINSDLVSTYEQIRDNVRAVISELNEFGQGKDFYYELRSADPRPMSPPRRAARFIYLNRYCFNGLYRTNRQGHFNVPYGGLKTGEIPSESLLLACSNQLSRASLVCGDFGNVLAKVRPGDFVYMDPPYSVKASRVFNGYDASVFSEEELARLRKWMENLHDRGIHFVVSYASCDEAEYLKKGFYCSEATVNRNIAGFTGNRRKTSEVIITNQIPI